MATEGVLRVLERDERAFEEFVSRSGNRLLRNAILLVGDPGVAEDLLQGALERTYRHWSQVSTGHPEAYVRRVLVNAAASRWRRRRIREVPLEAAHDIGRTYDPDRLSLRDGLTRALMALPVRQRAVLVLRYFEDMSEMEVALTLGCSLGTVKSQASRGLARLRTSSHLDDVQPATRRVR